MRTDAPIGGGSIYDFIPNTGSLDSTYSQNTNVVGSWPTGDEPSGCFAPPSGCNLGFYAPNIPTCAGGDGGDGGGGCSPACNANGTQCSAQSGGAACPANWKNKDCADLPCAYRDECGCSACLHGCSPSCTGGGCGTSPTPTPTPTPTPYCTLQCPGTPISQFDGTTLIPVNASLGQFTSLGQGGAGGGGGSIQGTSTSSRLLAQNMGGGGGGSLNGGGSVHSCGDVSQALGTDPTYLTFGFGEVRGNLTYMGYNSHSCSTVYGCPMDQGESCPAPTIVVQKQTQGPAVAGASDNPSLLNILKSLTSRLLAQNMGGGGGSIGGGGGGSQTGTSTTWTTTKTMNRLDASNPTLYGFTATGVSGKSCSCQVLLGCQQSLQASPNSAEMEIDTCESQCTFTVDASTEYPEARETTSFTIQANEGFERTVTLDYDNGTVDTLSEPYPASSSHVFENAGTYDVKLTCSNAGGQSKVCTRRLNMYCAGSGDLPTPTPTPPLAWSKFKDTSLTKSGAVSNSAPTGALEYDSTDRGVCNRNDHSSLACVSSGKSGVTTVRGASSEFGTRLSDNEWLRTDPAYSANNLITPDSFIEYVKARKDVQVLQSVTQETLVPNKVNLFVGDVVITDNSLPGKLSAGEKVVLVVDGVVSIDASSDPADTFNPDNVPFAIISTGELEISAETTELKGIFIANTVDFAYDATPSTSTPLKISGNLSYMQTSTACSDKRIRTDSSYKPSCFISFDFVNQYLPLIDLLSTRTYEWTELVP